MERQITTTADGSKTLYIPQLDEGYHSHHGALQEARHVFIENGLKFLDQSKINIVEMGFGTGLNALVTVEELLKSSKDYQINYFGIEKYPVNPEEILELNYQQLFDTIDFKIVNSIHETKWGTLNEILPNFYLKKIKSDFYEFNNLDLPEIDLVYFDCFGARVQPDLWEEPLFRMISGKMRQGAILTTYSSKGSVRRILQTLGFTVYKKAGPPGKREMMVAIKN